MEMERTDHERDFGKWSTYIKYTGFKWAKTCNTVCMDPQNLSIWLNFAQPGSVAECLNNALWVIGALWYFHSSRKFPYSLHIANNSPGALPVDNQQRPTVWGYEYESLFVEREASVIGQSELIVWRVTNKRGTRCLTERWKMADNHMATLIPQCLKYQPSEIENL